MVQINCAFIRCWHGVRHFSSAWFEMGKVSNICIWKSHSHSFFFVGPYIFGIVVLKVSQNRIKHFDLMCFSSDCYFNGRKESNCGQKAIFWWMMLLKCVRAIFIQFSKVEKFRWQLNSAQTAFLWHRPNQIEWPKWKYRKRIRNLLDVINMKAFRCK